MNDRERIRLEIMDPVASSKSAREREAMRWICEMDKERVGLRKRIVALEAAARPALTFMECYPGEARGCSGCDDDHECVFRALRALVPVSDGGE